MYDHKTGASREVIHVLPKKLAAGIFKFLAYVRGEADGKDYLFSTVPTVKCKGGRLQNLQDCLELFKQMTGWKGKSTFSCAKVDITSITINLQGNCVPAILGP